MDQSVTDGPIIAFVGYVHVIDGPIDGGLVTTECPNRQSTPCRRLPLHCRLRDDRATDC